MKNTKKESKKATINLTNKEVNTMANSIRKQKNKLNDKQQFKDALISLIDETIPIINELFPYSDLKNQSDYIKDMLNGITQFSDHFVCMYIHELKDIQKKLMCVDEIFVEFQSEHYNQKAIKKLQLIEGALGIITYCVLADALRNDVSISTSYLDLKFMNAA